MLPTPPVVEAALAQIASAQLNPTEHLLLKDLVESAVEPTVIAQHIIQRIEDNPGKTTEDTLRHLKSDWRKLTTKLTNVVDVPSKSDNLTRSRLSSPCSFTKASNHDGRKQGDAVYIIPPTLFEGPDMMPKGSLYLLLEKFLTPSKTAQLQSMLLDGRERNLPKNLWLLSPSVHSAFRSGHIKIRPKLKLKWDEDYDIDVTGATEAKYTATKLYPEECTDLYLGDGSLFEGVIHIFTMHTPDPENLPLPSAFLLCAHYRFSTALHLFPIEDKIARGWPRQSSALFGKWAQQNMCKVWLLVPKFVRVLCYHALLKAGQFLYPDRLSLLVQRMPFGLYFKRCARAQGNEPNALKMVQQHTSIRAPLLVDTFQDNGDMCMVMTRIRGQMLADVFHLMSYNERDQFADDLRACIQQLRAIPNNTPYLFADTTGGRMIDHRVPDRECGPFNTEADFNNHLYHCGVGSDLIKSIEPVHSRKHESYFTHSDLHTTNLLVEGGRLCGIVDWECAAFKPEYWEFTKAMYGVWNRGPIENMFRRVFGALYSEELEVEQALWKVTPFGV